MDSNWRDSLVSILLRRSIIESASKLPEALAYWDFTDESKLTEGNTTDFVEGWADSSPAPSYTLSQLSSVLQPFFNTPDGPVFFDGSDYLVSDLDMLSTPFTVITRFESTSSATQRIVSNKGTSSANGFDLTTVSNGSIYVRGDGNSQTLIYTPSGGFQNVDMTIAVTIDGSNAELFRDGVSEVSGTITAPSAVSTDFTIGALTSGSEAFTGDFYSVLFFDRVLTSSEIVLWTEELNP